MSAPRRQARKRGYSPSLIHVHTSERLGYSASLPPAGLNRRGVCTERYLLHIDNQLVGNQTFHLFLLNPHGRDSAPEKQ